MLSYLFKQKLVFLFLAFWAFFLGIMPNLSQASLVESKSYFNENAYYESDLAKVKMFLGKDIAAKKLQSLGIDRDELLKRIEKLDAQQVHELAMRCDRIKVGGAGGIWLVVAIVALVIIAILYFINYTVRIEPRDTIPRRY